MTSTTKFEAALQAPELPIRGRLGVIAVLAALELAVAVVAVFGLPAVSDLRAVRFENLFPAHAHHWTNVPALMRGSLDAAAIARVRGQA